MLLVPHLEGNSAKQNMEGCGGGGRIKLKFTQAWLHYGTVRILDTALWYT
jgi:hypothetical protein